jgi:hypothetical protein
MQEHQKATTEPKNSAIAKLPIRNYHIIDFDVIREEWNKYKLEDGTIVKSKFVLINFMLEKSLEELIKEAKKKSKTGMGVSLQSKNIMGVEAPTKLRGIPSSSYTPQELQASIIKKDVDFEVIKERRNEYKLKNGMTIKVRHSPLEISKSSKFDSYGLPIYMVNSTADIAFVFPEEIKKELKSSKKHSRRK